jgi:hypothetical protein
VKQELIDRFIEQLESERYYDAHESLEELWFPRRFEDNDEVRLLKGFINAAVSFELVKRGRPGPSERAWKNYLKYRPLLEQIESEFCDAYRDLAKRVESIKSVL